MRSDHEVNPTTQETNPIILGQVFTDAAVTSKLVTDGVMVNLGQGRYGYMHITEMVAQPGSKSKEELNEARRNRLQLLREGNTAVTVAVVKITDPENKGGKTRYRVSEWEVLKSEGYKRRRQKQEAMEELESGALLYGTVSKIFPWGVVVTLKSGLSGTLHVSQLRGRDRLARDSRLSEFVEGQSTVLVELLGEPKLDEKGRPRLKLKEQGAGRS